MIAVDTSVLVRLLVDDASEPAQPVAARALAREAGAVHVPLVVLVETVWVLETCYGLDRAQVLGILTHLSANDAYRLEAPKRCEAALAQFRDNAVDFSDCLILAGCRDAELALYTFDKRLSRLDGAEPVPMSGVH